MIDRVSRSESGGLVQCRLLDLSDAVGERVLGAALSARN